MFVKSSDAKNHRKNHLKTFLKDKVVVIINFGTEVEEICPGNQYLCIAMYIFLYIYYIYNIYNI